MTGIVLGDDETVLDDYGRACAWFGVGVSGDATLSPRFESEVQQLETALKNDPKNLNALIQLGNLYYDWGQNEVDTKGETAQPEGKWVKAIEYYGQALKITPANADVRTDMGTALFYLGDSDKALAEFEKSLSYRPNHPNTLFNTGIVKWQGKNDAKGAIASWEKLLRENPNFQDAQKVRDLIAQAKASGQ